MKKVLAYRRWFILAVVCSIGLLSSAATSVGSGTSIDKCLVNAPAEIDAYLPGVIYESSRQICTSRMGCTCKHRRGDTDTLKKHTPEDDPYDDQNSWNPHLDIKCTKCNSDWYCPVFKRYRG